MSHGNRTAVVRQSFVLKVLGWEMSENRKGHCRGRRADVSSAGMTSLTKLGISASLELTALP